MKRFLYLLAKSGLFFGILYTVAVLWLIPFFLAKKYGASNEDQIRFAFEKVHGEKSFDWMVLGNSHMSYGVDPSVFSRKAFNFSYINESFNQCFYKMRFLKELGKLPDTLILGVDFFEFGIHSDVRNYAYSSYFDPAYLEDYPSTNVQLFYWLNRFNPITLNQYRHGSSSVMMENGMMTRESRGKVGESKRRKMEWLEVQKDYFGRIMDFSAQNNISLYLVMQPLLPQEFNQYSEEELAGFYEFIDNSTSDFSNVRFLNFSEVRLKESNYSDNTHLNAQGAKIFTSMIDSAILSQPSI